MKIVGKKKYMENKIMDKRLYHVDIVRILVVFVICGAITYLLKRIPVIKNYL